MSDNRRQANTMKTKKAPMYYRREQSTKKTYGGREHLLYKLGFPSVAVCSSKSSTGKGWDRRIVGTCQLSSASWKSSGWKSNGLRVHRGTPVSEE